MSGGGPSSGERGGLAGPLVVATHNAGKLREINELLAPYGVETLGAGALGLPEPEETGDLSRQRRPESAKRRRARRGWLRSPTIPGFASRRSTARPGIYSARWAGESKDFSAAMARVESELEARGAPQPWRADFISVLALAWPDGLSKISRAGSTGPSSFRRAGRPGSATIRSSSRTAMRAPSAR